MLRPMTTPPVQAAPTHLVAERLGVDGLRAAYPLIRQAQPSVDLRAWERFARRLARPGGGEASGIVAVRYARRPFPSGLFCYRRERDLSRGRVLTAEHLVALDLLDPETVLTALLHEIDTLGARLGCGAARVVVPPGPLAALLRRRAEDQNESAVFFRPLRL